MFLISFSFPFFFLGKNWSILWGKFAGKVIQWRKIMQQAQSLSARLGQGPASSLVNYHPM
jgi:hypothetical protein